MCVCVDVWMYVCVFVGGVDTRAKLFAREREDCGSLLKGPAGTGFHVARANVFSIFPWLS